MTFHLELALPLPTPVERLAFLRLAGGTHRAAIAAIALDDGGIAPTGRLKLRLPGSAGARGAAALVAAVLGEFADLVDAETPPPRREERRPR